jgi:hypothetical protein
MESMSLLCSRVHSEQIGAFSVNAPAFLMHRNAYPLTDFLAVRTSPLRNPRALLGYESRQKSPGGASGMLLPPGHR